VNPASVHYFGESSLKRNKTDKIDAELIAKFDHDPKKGTN
jgi:transposase